MSRGFFLRPSPRRARSVAGASPTYLDRRKRPRGRFGGCRVRRPGRNAPPRRGAGAAAGGRAALLLAQGSGRLIRSTSDRGVVAPGMRADLNLIDFDQLRATMPYVCNDLPQGGKRVLQKATGYRRTLVKGVTTYLEGEPTGAMPGRLVRGTTTL